MGLIIERIPHKSVAYAFLEVQAATANEFETLRAEALKRAPHYGFAEAAPAQPKKAVDSPQKVEADEAAAENAGVADQAAPVPEGQAAAAPATTSTEGLSPREIAKLKMAAKKEAQSG